MITHVLFDFDGTLVESMDLSLHLLNGLSEKYHYSRVSPEDVHRLKAMPLRVFSGKEHPSPGAKAVFFCFALPAPSAKDREAGPNEVQMWTEEAGHTKWYLFVLDSSKVLEEPAEMIGLIRSKPDTPRHRSLEEKTLAEIRAKVERHITNSYLRQVQAPVGVKPVLKCWMELS